MLRETLEDRRLSRGEKRALDQVLEEHSLRHDELAFWRHRAFAIAKDALPKAKTGSEGIAILDWLEDVVKLVSRGVETNPSARSSNQISEVIFSPGRACRSKIAQLLGQARQSADICVFTITDDRLAEPIFQAHQRGVKVRIVTDDEKSHDLGSDVEKLAQRGVAVRRDRSPHHMHHKFAVFDGATVVTGSYNWTRSAAEHNRENLVVSDDPRIVAPFAASFEALWKDLE